MMKKDKVWFQKGYDCMLMILRSKVRNLYND